jgi:hypothetical protein
MTTMTTDVTTEPGWRIRITEGPHAGMCGEILRLNTARTRATVQLDGGETATRVSLADIVVIVPRAPREQPAPPTDLNLTSRRLFSCDYAQLTDEQQETVWDAIAAGPTLTQPYTFTTFNAVARVDDKHVHIPAERRARFRQAAEIFARDRDAKVILEMATAEEAEEYRAQVETFAAENNLVASLPRFIRGHWARSHVVSEVAIRDEKGNPVTDDSGRPVREAARGTGQVIPAHWIPDNSTPVHWNTGRNVVFRFSPHRGE